MFTSKGKGSIIKKKMKRKEKTDKNFQLLVKIANSFKKEKGKKNLIKR